MIWIRLSNFILRKETKWHFLNRLKAKKTQGEIGVENQKTNFPFTLHEIKATTSQNINISWHGDEKNYNLNLKFQLTLKFLRRGSNLSFPFPDLLWQQILVNFWQNSSVRNSHTSQKLPQFLIVPHRKLYVPRYDTSLLVVPCRISSKLQYLPDTQTTSGIKKKIRKKKFFQIK